jgi:hypothetical protein
VPTGTDSEKVLLERSLQLGEQVVNVRVSNLSVAFGGRVFATRHISSVAVFDDAFRVGRRKAAMLVAAATLMGFAWLAWDSVLNAWWSVGMAGFGALMFAAIFGLKVTYHVNIRGGGDDARVLSSRDLRLIGQVVSAIKEARSTAY